MKKIGLTLKIATKSFLTDFQGLREKFYQGVRRYRAPLPRLELKTKKQTGFHWEPGHLFVRNWAKTKKETRSTPEIREAFACMHTELQLIE